jgi:LPS-assembly protein
LGILALAAASAAAQTPGLIRRDAASPPSQTASQPPEPPPPASLAKDQWDVDAIEQESIGKLHKLRGNAWVENNQMLVRADQMDWDEDTGDMHASGHVHIRRFEENEDVWCDHLDYNTTEETGKFYTVHGQTVTRIVTRPGILTSRSPFYFEGEWAERVGGKYILHNGFVTNCSMPKPWWRMRGPKFVIYPREKALAYRSIFFLHGVPLFYAPYFYHSLEKEPRKSGFLAPNIGNSSQRGIMLGLGYYWAISHSYDVTYQLVDYTARGYAHNVDFRGKPFHGTDFYAIVYGVQDRGVVFPGATTPTKYSGFNLHAVGKSDLGNGWTLHADANYFTSLRFHDQWTQSYNELTGSEVRNTGYIDKNWPDYSLDIVFSHLENYQGEEIAIPPGSTNYVADAVVIRKLPEAEFSSRDLPIWQRLPVWFSWDSSAGLLYRSSPVFSADQTQLIDRFQTGQLTNRENLAPRITGAFHLWDFHFVPSAAIHESFYSEGQAPVCPAAEAAAALCVPGLDRYRTTGTDYVRSAQDFSLDLIMPTLERVYNKKSFLGDKVKHVIEPRATYRYVTGVGADFDKFIRFDGTDLLSNTNELLLSLTNRLYAKRGDSVQEVFTWTVMQKRYFDPTFGGALVEGQRNVFESTADLAAYAFLAGPRGESPIVSSLRISPIGGFGIRWQADYDPRTHSVVDSALALDYRWRKRYFVMVNNDQVHVSPVLGPIANQYTFRVGYGDANRKGFNAHLDGVYNYLTEKMLSSTAQITYNTDCCGLSIQYYRYNINNVRDEGAWRIAFSIANVATFGNLKKQSLMF